MARLQYGPYVIQEQALRSLAYHVEPVYDNSNLELLYNQITIDVHAIVNTLAFASNDPAVVAIVNGVPPAPPVFPLGGDRVGLTLRAVEDQMRKPRQTLMYWIGADLVLDVPGRITADGASRFPCCPMGGPIVKDCRLFELKGTKTAMLHFRVVCAGPSSTRPYYLLSNRWTQQHSIDSRGYTTVTTIGHARFRMDYLERAFDDRINVDSFRHLLLPPAELRMRRVSVQVTASERGDACNYIVVDREVQYGTGPDSGIEKIEGTCTLGIVRPLGDAKGTIDTVRTAIRKMTLLDFNGIGDTIWDKMVARPQANIVVRAYGQKFKNKLDLMNVAVRVIYDRFEPSLIRGDLFFFSFAVTQWIGSEDQPIVEVRASVLPAINKSLKAILDLTEIQGAMNWDQDYFGMNGELNFGVNADATQLPGGNNSRGYYIGQMVGQVLASTAGSDYPPAPQYPLPWVEMADNE